MIFHTITIILFFSFLFIGLDVEGEVLVKSLENLVGMSLKVHVVEDLFLTTVEVEDFFLLCSDAGAAPISSIEELSTELVGVSLLFVFFL